MEEKAARPPVGLTGQPEASSRCCPPTCAPSCVPTSKDQDSPASAGLHVTRSSRSCLPPHKRIQADTCKLESAIHMQLISFHDFPRGSRPPCVLATSPGERESAVHTSSVLARLATSHFSWASHKNNPQAELKEKLARNDFHSYVTANSNPSPPSVLLGSCAYKSPLSCVMKAYGTVIYCMPEAAIEATQ